MDNTTTQAKNANDEKLGNPGPPRPGTAEGVASFVGRKADDAAAYVGHKAEDAASYVGQRTEDAGAAVGGGLRSLGKTVRDRGPEGGMGGEASSAVANALESSGRYLQEEGLKVMAQDVTDVIGPSGPAPASPQLFGRQGYDVTGLMLCRTMETGWKPVS